ncbi:WGR domain-containing protein (plasmid) [Nostoc sp. UHCC 0302]|uniref:WGR domain-containing protein n=1 Tax=Nostoc sp. UHCC 0302 TaxID=3134896 RepID=UPI00311CBC47
MYSYLVYVDAANNSNKFWSAKVESSQLTVQWGRVGYNAQTKTHSFNSHQQALSKYHNLVAEKKTKGYRESQPQIETSDVYKIERAIGLLNGLRSYVVNRNFDEHYIQLLNQYLKIVPTPLGMQIDPYTIYRTITDVDHQRELLNSLLTTPAPQVAVVGVATTTEPTEEPKTISKNFWRHL